MLQNILVTALTPLQSVDEINCWDNRPFTGMWPENNRDKSTDIKKTIKKKPKRIRTAYTTEQLRTLEMLYTQSKYIASERRREISKALNIGDKSVKIWFQNRRMKEKRESSESSSDSSSETFANESSAPSMVPNIPTKLQNSNQLPSNTNQDTKQFYSPESCQYQSLPLYVYNGNNEKTHTSHAFDNNVVQSNCMQFYTDNNVYPTQYYPYNENHYSNYDQCQQENAIYGNNWCVNNMGSCYYYN